jgi:GNAT superfamily N-acetyltransferase
MFHELVAGGADIASRPRSTHGEVRADIVLTGAELSALTARGARTVQVVQRAGDGRTFLQTQVNTTVTDDPDVEITVTWRTASGATGSYELFRFEDADDDVEAAERQVLALGATRLPGELEGRYRVFADPVGHPFCLVFGRHGPTAVSRAGDRQIRAGGADDIAACRDIVAGLPEFFTPDTGDTIAADLATHDSWVVTDGTSVTGFAVAKRRSAAAAEILWVAVAPTRRGHGIGTALVGHVLDALRASGMIVVAVKTLDPSADHPPYAATYRFWTARGFVHVDTIDPLPGWEPGNPCAILVAPLAAVGNRRST